MINRNGDRADQIGTFGRKGSRRYACLEHPVNPEPLWHQGVRFASWSTGIGGDHPYTAAYQCSAGSQGLPYVPSWRIAVVDLVGLPDVSAFRLSFSPLVGLLELL